MEFRPAMEEIGYHHLKQQTTRSELNSHLGAKPLTGRKSSSAEHSLDRLALGFIGFFSSKIWSNYSMIPGKKTDQSSKDVKKIIKDLMLKVLALRNNFLKSICYRKYILLSKVKYFSKNNASEVNWKMVH